MNRILVDIDGVLTHKSGYGIDYKNAPANRKNIDYVNMLSKNNEIIIYTSRLEEDREVTIQWLKEQGVIYGEILFKKPKANMYIDDMALNFVPFMASNKLNRKKLVLSYSGGMDSYIAYHYAIKELGYKEDDILCINFNIGQPYQEKEQKAMDTLEVPYIQINLTDLLKYGERPTKDKYIIINRNMIFASICAMYGEKVWIVGSKFENHALMFDKNEDFYRAATISLSQSCGEMTIVETPFLEMTKGDMIQWAKDNEIDLSVTVSCYDEDIEKCGTCGLCYKRNIAMLSAGIKEEFANDPFNSEYHFKLMQEYENAIKTKDFSHYSLERIKSDAKILDSLGVENNLQKLIGG